MKEKIHEFVKKPMAALEEICRIIVPDAGTITISTSE
jgi:hypothetical protein